MKYRLQVAGHNVVSVEEARPQRIGKMWIEIARFPSEEEARRVYPTAKWRERHNYKETHTKW